MGLFIKNYASAILLLIDQAQKEKQPKKTAPRRRKLDSLSDLPGFQAVKR